jgi:predicted outer membrane repeat protein
VNHNTAPGAPGGGILNHGTMTITGSQVNGNSAPTDSSGDLGDGGGIANVNLDLVLESEGVPSPPPSGVLTIIASQVNGNSASGLGGGIADVGINAEGAPTAPAGALTLKLVLVTGNTAGVDGGGLYTSPGSPVSLKASLIIKNTPDNCSPLGSIAGCKN